MRDNNLSSNELIFDARTRLKEREYWLSHLSGDLVKSHFPFDRVKKPLETAEGASALERVDFSFTGETFARMMQLSNKSDIRLYIILLAGVMVLLEKYTGDSDIIVGSPIYRQESDSDLINNILPIRTQVHRHLSFKELLLRVSKINSRALANINYPIETLPYELNLPMPGKEFALFDTGVLVENIHEKSYIDHLHLNVVFCFKRVEGSVKGLLEYNRDLYRGETMERISSHYMNLVQQAIFSIDSTIDQLSILSPGEKQQLLFDFNDSDMDYPSDKTIHELFEEQVERTPGDIALIGKGLSGGEPVQERCVLTYRQLNEAANQVAKLLKVRGIREENISAVLTERSLEQVIALLSILKAGGAYLPIDIEYPAERINYLLQDSDAKLLLTTSDWVERVEFGGPVLDVADEGLYQGEGASPGRLGSSSSLAYVIYTSGTTGKPKGVMIEHGSVVNYIWWAARTYVRDETRDFPLYSSISFDLTVTSLFTPLVTGNTIVVYNESDEGSGGKVDFLIERIIEENRVKVVKLTPSHLYVLKYKDLSRWDVKCFIVGGEELDTVIADRIDTRFRGNIEIYNEYGPTEATVGCICYCFDPAKDTGGAVPIGQPAGNVRVYILDCNLGLVPIGAVGEIYIGGDGVGRGYINQQELTAEKFLCGPVPVVGFSKGAAAGPGQKIYRSGDLGRWLPDGVIEFLGRADQQVKIRGYRIELGEIEQRLLEHESMKEVVVLTREFADQGSGGQKTDPYLCAYVVASEEFEASSLREYLQQRLPDYMVPLFFIQVEEIPLTSNGKIDRKALPEPEFSLDREYTAPRDEIELKLAETWSEILGMDRDRISIDANFFELGGHSLRQVMLVSHIHREFNVRISLASVFKIPSIRGLSGYIKDSSKTGYSSIVQVEEKEYYPVSSAQKRIFFVHGLDNTGINYNVPIVLELEGELDRERFNAIIRALIKRHESLRTSFKMIGEEPVQQVHSSDAVEFQLGYYHLAAYSEKTNGLKRADSPGLKVGGRPGEKGEEGHPVLKPLFGEADPEVEKIIKKRILRPFDLSHAPLLRLAIIEISKREFILVIDMHHIITDGTSQNILEQEIISLYSTPGSQLQPLQLRYKDFSEWENIGERKQTIKQQESYWFKAFSDIDELPVLNLPTDYPRPLMQDFEGNWVNFGLSRVETKILKDIGEENEATLYIVLLAVFNILFSKLSGQEDIVLGTPIAARRHPDLQQGVGMMVNTLAMRNYPAVDKTFTGFLQEVKQRTLQAFENQEYPFEDLVDQLALERDTSRNPLFDVMLNLLNQAEYRGEIAPADDHPPYRHIEAVTRFDLTFYAVDLEESMAFLLEYSSRIFSPTTIERFIKYLKTIIINLPGNTDRRLSDITIISAEEKQEILKICTGEERQYDKCQTIHTLFQEQAALTPDQAAVVRDMRDEKFGVHSLTYKELNQRSNQVAHLLRSKGVGPNTIVGIVMEPCIERVTGILGILKAGGAYLPIDPRYPAKRILSILDDSHCYFLLTDETIRKRFDFISLESLKSVHVNPHLTRKRAQIKELDSLPFPNRTYVSYEKFHQCIGIAMARHTVSIQATRGCPFKCAYCHKIWPKTHMVRSAENIFQEVKHLHSAGIRRFVFVDDTFNLNRKNSEKFLEMIIKYLPGLQLFFPNGLRGDILDKEFIDLLVQAGTVNIAVALENPSPRLQEMMLKRLRLDRFSEMVHYITQKHPQVILEMQLMIGFPTETEEETLNLLDFIKKFKWLHFPNLHVLKIYPNTDMYRLALENGVSAAAIEASTSYAYHELPETLPYSRHFAKQFQTRFMDEYMLCKERLLHVLPHQLKVLTREELIRKYNSYFPENIRTFNDILRMGGISAGEFPEVPFLENDYMAAPHFREKLKALQLAAAGTADADAMRILLLDLSQLFTSDAEGMLYDMVEAPLGLMYLITYLDKQFKSRVKGKIAKSRVDFDSFQELKDIVTGFNPHLIGLRTLSYFKDFYHQTLWHLRHWGVDVPIICGGPYASSDYPQMLQDHHITLAVIGEGELTAAELVGKMLENNKKLPPEEELMEIPGLAFIKKQDRPVLEQKRRKIITLDKVGPAGSSPGELPFHAYPVSNLENFNQPGDLLYLISTSGSTGQPKSVMLEHRNLVNLMQFQFLLPGIDFTHVLQFASIGFDVSAQEIFSTLLSGGKLFLLSSRKKHDIPWLLDYIKRNDIGILFLPPAFLKFVFSEPEYAEGFPKCVRHIIAAGEQLVVTEPFRKYLNDNQVVLHNHYGPTETHVVSSLILDPNGEIPELPSIGRPISNTMLYILDEKRELKPVGVPGELYISGENVGRGYYNREKQTRENFIPDPFFPGNRMYRTGDLARWLPDENIEFLGRKDQQVKIRGFRIEPGEIEKKLLNRIDIKKAVVIAREREEGAENQRYLCAYIVSDTEIDIPGLIKHLSRELPDYMIPSYFEQLKEIPLTTSGKLDRRALPSPEVKPGEEYAAPRNEIEKKLVDIWSQVLQVDKEVIGIDSDFFQLGGHSLKATALAARIHKGLDVALPLAEVLKNPNIRGLSNRIKELTQHKYVSIEAVEKKEYYPLSSAQKRLYILQQMDKEGNAYNLPYVAILEGSLDKVRFEESFRDLIKRHESLRTSFEMVGKQPVQRIHDTVEFSIDYNEKPVDAEWSS